MKTKKVKNFVKSPEYQKNEVRFKLLTILPEFQEDIKKVRKEFNIPINGIFDSKLAGEWYHREIIEKTDEIMGSKKFLEQKKNLSMIKDYPEYIKQKWELDDTVPLFRLGHRTEKLCKKYKLPWHFNTDMSYGSSLYAYLTQNKLIPPSNNWVIEQDPEGRSGTSRWLSIKTYAPLSKKELRDAMCALDGLQKHYFPKSVIVNTRVKNQFERDLEIFNELTLERNKKQTKVKTKKYIEGSYLSILSKNETDSKKIRKLEKLNPDSIKAVLKFDEKTSREISKRFGMTPDAVRKSIQRVSLLIGKFFGDEYLGH